ncbi:MAG TPA: hydantoinase B/oxoprolinase family protein [Pyrodictium sp.]|nr:hydantoinase B/oxoprolinase family protein [Pyrodictium sp.]
MLSPLHEAIWHGLIYAAEEMGVILQQTAISPNIRDRLDFSCAILDPTGRLVAQAEHIPVHLGTMAVAGPLIVDRVLREYSVEPGDIYITNDPYLAGTHLNDITVLKPVFYSNRVVAWLINKAHHVDVGGSVPGSIGGRVSSLIEEGTIIPLVRLARRGDIDKTVIEILAANSRTPLQLKMDLHAQLAALKRGEELVKQLIERYGVRNLLDAMKSSIEYVREYTRRSLEEYKGRASAEDVLEGMEKDYVIKVGIDIGGGSARVDYEGTSLQAQEPLNSVFHVTVAATTFALKMVFDPQMPVNQGFYEVVDIVAPKGTLVNPIPPAPVSAYTETSQRIVDVVLRALAQIVPERVPAASGGTMTNVSFGGRGWAFYETIGCGFGARPSADGVDGVHVNMTNTLNTPIEVLEQLYPIRVLRYELRSGSGGLGKYRGGLGIVREYLALDHVKVSIAGNRVRSRPWGLNGGLPGKPARYIVVRSNGVVEELPPIASVELAPGERLIVETPGGGGYGDPCERPEHLIREDVDEGKVQLEEIVKILRKCGKWKQT